MPQGYASRYTKQESQQRYSNPDNGYATNYLKQKSGGKQKMLGYTSKYMNQQLNKAGTKDLSYKTRYIGANSPKSPMGGSNNNSYTSKYTEQKTGASRDPKGYGAGAHPPTNNRVGQRRNQVGRAKDVSRVVTETGYMVLNHGSNSRTAKIAKRLKSKWETNTSSMTV